MTRRGVSLREVARLAGVSPGTASRVLSGSSYPVSEAARRRVEEAALALNYVPDSNARALVTGRTAIIGAVVHDITDPYFSGVVRGLEDAAMASGLVVLVGSDDRDARKLESYLTMLLSQRPAGVALVGGQLRDPAATLPIARAVQRLRDRGVAVVAVGRYELDIPHVAIDDSAAARQAVTYLLQLGHKRIAFVGGPLNSTTVEDRYAGYVTALTRAGLAVDDDLVVQTSMSFTGGSEAVERLRTAQVAFTAVFAATDDVAFGVVAGLKEAGLCVPADVSVIGMNDVPMCAHVDPPLTTIHVPQRTLGLAAWRLLMSQWQHETVRDEGVVPFDLVVRGSTAEPRAF